MKMKLGLLEKDLASRFEISFLVVSRIFVTWVKGLSSFKTFIIYARTGKFKYDKTKTFNQMQGYIL